MKRITGALVVMSLFACQPKSATRASTNPAKEESGQGAKDGDEDQDGSEQDDDDKIVTPEPVKDVMSKGPNSRVICKAPDGINTEPRSMPDMIKLINALPKPVTVACVVDALKGPFRVNATSSAFSAQPAYSEDAPRIFLFYEPLYISIVPTGMGGDMIEFSIQTGPEESVKGELAFPVKDTITEDAAYEHIKFETANATVCGSCHSGERPAGDGFPANAFISSFLRTMDVYDVSAKQIEKSAKRCQTEVLPECKVLEALTSKGALIQTNFK
ncbi:MAG: hypothetical protein EOP09_16365 [Proteobacteria bacterium]|nr:MAG: hypothetical protein EOP09_16365 [Pseudomonadota bacterium]